MPQCITPPPPSLLQDIGEDPPTPISPPHLDDSPSSRLQAALLHYIREDFVQAQVRLGWVRLFTLYIIALFMFLLL